MKTKLFKGMLLLFVLLAMAVAVKAVSHNEVNEDKLALQAPPSTKPTGVNTVKKESNGVYQFHDDAVRVAIEEYMGKESNELTQEDLKTISQITYLNIEGRIQAAEDIPIILPNLVGLDVSISEEADSAISNILLLKDVNFDGKEDILIDNGITGSEVTFTCFLYSEDGYKKSESFSQIRNPAVDAKEKKILSTWRNSSNSHSYAMYSIENGEYVETERLTIEILRNEESYKWCYQIEKRADKEMEEWKVTDEGILSSEQFKDQFSSEDSYWGVMTKKWLTFFESDGYCEVFGP